MTKPLLIFCVASFGMISQAQDSFLDPSFGNKGRMNFSVSIKGNSQFAKNGLLFIHDRIIVT